LALQLNTSGLGILSYFDLLARSEKISEGMLRINKMQMSEWTTSDSAFVRLVKNMYEVGTSVENPPPHCIVMADGKGAVWTSPWGFIVKRQSAALSDKRILSLLKMRDAYLKNDQEHFTAAAKQFIDDNKMEQSAGFGTQSPAPELFYNALSPFSKAKIALGIAALLALMTLFSRSRLLYWASAGLVAAGWILMTTGILLRMSILGHPPLSSLYETLIFVAWITILIGTALELFRMRPIGLIIASITGFIFIHVAGKFAGDGDTMGMLVAVLDSSFWLTTHIITIALGYAGCVGAGVLAHIYLLQKVMQKSENPSVLQMEKALYGIFSFGLVFTVIGTILGGFWADQAWGGFWGWDPKENGALLIILWCLAVVHARRGGMVGNIGIAVGSIIATILVMCCWIGVNALGVGLHSYGFSSSGLQGLIIYFGCEVAFLAAIGFFYLRRKKQIA
jgi:ABC-type transport system involved in cytochrome c biogenesis permease subunit